MTWSRREVLKLLPGSLGACAFAGTVGAASSVATGAAGCGGTAGSVVVTGGTALLTFAAFPDLSATGGGVVVGTSGSLDPFIVVLRTSATVATALSGTCTHEGCAVNFESGAMDLYCGCHGSRFSEAGAVLVGPARTSLPKYVATIGATGITVTGIS